jgi:CubicO group peptidase (beta-lactamase class C family)
MRHPFARAISICAAAVATACAQAPAPSEESSKLIPGLMDRAGVPGLSMSVIHDGAIAWQGTFGVRNWNTGEKIETRSVFEAASLGKPVFAYGVLAPLRAVGYASR